MSLRKPETGQAAGEPPRKKKKKAAVHCIDVSVCCIDLKIYATDRSGLCNRQIRLCNGQLPFFPPNSRSTPELRVSPCKPGSDRCNIGESRGSMWTWGRRGQSRRTISSIPANTREPGPAWARAALIERIHVNLGPRGPERLHYPGYSCKYMRTGLRTDESGSDARIDVNLAPRGPHRVYRPRYPCEDV